MRIPLALILCFGVFVASALAEEVSVVLTVKPVPDDFFSGALDGQSSELEGKEDSIFVVGVFNPPTFSIQDISNIELLSADSVPIPLIIEKASLYSEFEGAGINSMRIAFIISQLVLDKGAPTLRWGESVSASYKEVAKIEIYKGDREHYRTFLWEERPNVGENPYTATIEVIVDDYADVYYVWYLLPMAIIFVLLFIRKAVIK